MAGCCFPSESVTCDNYLYHDFSIVHANERSRCNHFAYGRAIWSQSKKTVARKNMSSRNHFTLLGILFNTAISALFSEAEMGVVITLSTAHTYIWSLMRPDSRSNWMNTWTKKKPVFLEDLNCRWLSEIFASLVLWRNIKLLAGLSCVLDPRAGPAHSRSGIRLPLELQNGLSS